MLKHKSILCQLHFATLSEAIFLQKSFVYHLYLARYYWCYC